MSPLAEGSMAVAVESDNPYRDFRESMEEEMVAAHSLLDCTALEKLLGMVPRSASMASTTTYTLIVGVFVNLLLARPPTTRNIFPDSFFTNG
ncbi:hypothetical protein ACP4OV_005370 [Aristida adscensionis]